VQQQVGTVDVRHRKNVDVAAHPVAERSLEPFWCERLLKPRVRGVVKRKHANIDDVSFVSGSRVGDVLYLHGLKLQTNERTFTLILKESIVSCALRIPTC